MAYPPFGAAGTIEEESLVANTDQLEFRDGFDTDIFSLKFTDTWRRSKPSYCAQTYGIGKSDDSDRNNLGKPLDTVTMTEEEECTTPHMLATQPGVSPSLGDKLTYTDGLIFFRKKITIRIVGKGTPPTGFTTADRGNTSGQVKIYPAVGDTPKIEESDLYIKSVEEGPKTVADWQKFTIELVKYVGNTVDNAQENMITPTLFTEGELDAVSHWYKITKTTTLNFNGPADVSESVEIYDEEGTP